MQKVFENIGGARELDVRGVGDEIRLSVVTKLGGARIGVTLPNATGTELALAVLEAMGTQDGTDEDLAAHYLRQALEARQRDQKLEALALELCNTYRAASEMKQLSSFEGYATLRAHWVPVAAKALELGASK